MGGLTVAFYDCYAKVNLQCTASSYDSAGISLANPQNDSVHSILAENCYWSGTTNATGRTGSILPYNSVDNNYNNTTNSGIYVTNCYYNKDLFTLTVIEASNGKGFTTEEMKEQSNYVGWDFENTWYMGEDGYPELKFE